MSDVTAPNWSLFYKLDGELPCEFREARYFESSLFVASGKVETWGESELRELPGTEEVHDAYTRFCRAAKADGYRLVREATYDPRHFDFATFTVEVREGARRAFAAVRRDHPERVINAFALLTDAGAMTIGPVAGTVDLHADDEDSEDTVWNCEDWDLFEGGAYLDVAYRMILTQHRGLPSQIPFDVFRQRMFESCIVALEELVRDGFFGIDREREDVVLRFQVSDDDDQPEAMRRLNVPALWERYQAWGQTWT